MAILSKLVLSTLQTPLMAVISYKVTSRRFYCFFSGFQHGKYPSNLTRYCFVLIDFWIQLRIPIEELNKGYCFLYRRLIPGLKCSHCCHV